MPKSGQSRSALRALAVVCALLAGGPVAALETVFVAPGAPDDLRERLRSASAVMAIEARGLDNAQEVLAAALSDYRTLIQVLYGQGYFSPVIRILVDGREAADLDPLNLPRRIDRIQITVAPGRPFRFGRTEIAPLAPGTELPEDFAPGRPASTGVLEETAIAGVRGWREAGHPKARVADQQLVVRHARAELDARFTIAPGPRLRFGRLNLAGTSSVRTESIYRIAGFPTGEVYDPEKLQRAATRLRRTGTFSSVSIREAETPNPDGTLDFTATVEDMPPRRLALGGEISSRTGVDLSFRWLHRNLFGGAERLQFETRLRNIGGTEAVDGRIALRLDRPDRFGPDDSMFYRADVERRNRTHYDVLTGLAGLGVRRTFSRNLFGEIFIAGAGSRSDDAFGINREFRYAILPVRVEWDRRDNRADPQGGLFLDARLIPFAGLGGTRSGGQLRVDGRGYWSPPGTGRFVLAGRVQLGSVIGPALSEVSPDLLFFSGGSGTVRGQPYESLGIPVGARVSGGRAFLGLSAEIRSKVTDKLSLVGFYDFGAVDSSSLTSGRSASHAGAGFGLRFDLGGLGPVRFDLGWPVNGATGSRMQFYLGIGQAF